MMQAFTTPASFLFLRFLGKGILASLIHDVLIPLEGSLHLIVSRLFVVRIDHTGSANKKLFCTSACFIS